MTLLGGEVRLVLRDSYYGSGTGIRTGMQLHHGSPRVFKCTGASTRKLRIVDTASETYSCISAVYHEVLVSL
jgi:hypothetical protein